MLSKMKNLFKEKKGIMGLDNVKAVILTLLIAAVMVIAMFAILVPLRTSVENIDNQALTVINETPITPTDAGVVLVHNPNTERNAVCTITAARNASQAAVIAASNYNVSRCRLANTTSTFSDRAWNVTYTVNYDNPQTNSLVENTTLGPINFFTNVPTFFTLLGVIVLVLIIAIIIIAVSRFAAGGGISAGGMGRGTGGGLESI